MNRNGIILFKWNNPKGPARGASKQAHTSGVAGMPAYEQRAMMVAMREDEAAATRKMVPPSHL